MKLIFHADVLLEIKVTFPADVLPRNSNFFFSEGRRQEMHIFPADVLLRKSLQNLGRF